MREGGVREGGVRGRSEGGRSEGGRSEGGRSEGGEERGRMSGREDEWEGGCEGGWMKWSLLMRTLQTH